MWQTQLSMVIYWKTLGGRSRRSMDLYLQEILNLPSTSNFSRINLTSSSSGNWDRHPSHNSKGLLSLRFRINSSGSTSCLFNSSRYKPRLMNSIWFVHKTSWILQYHHPLLPWKISMSTHLVSIILPRWTHHCICNQVSWWRTPRSTQLETSVLSQCSKMLNKISNQCQIKVRDQKLIQPLLSRWSNKSHWS